MSQTWNSELYDSKHAFVWARAADLLDLLEVKNGERILDLGCGTGHLTARIRELGGQVEGMDASAAMLDRARAAYPAISFWQGNVKAFSVEAPFDALFSNAAMHWVTDAAGAARSIAAALKPGGRFVAEFGGKGNVDRITSTLSAVLAERGHAFEHPWYFPSIAEYSALLEENGLETQKAWLFDRMTKLDDAETGIRDWLAMFGEQMLSTLKGDERGDVLTEFEQRARPHLFRDGRWFADYRRIRVAAVKAA